MLKVDVFMQALPPDAHTSIQLEPSLTILSRADSAYLTYLDRGVSYFPYNTGTRIILLFLAIYHIPMEGRININVSAVDYEKTSTAISRQLILLEEMVHSHDEFVMTDSEFAFGWHFFVVSVNAGLVEKLADQMGDDFDRFKGKGMEKKFLSWLAMNLENKSPRFKLAIKEEMESSKYGLF